MSLTLKASTADTAIHTIWEHLCLLQDNSPDTECLAALRAASNDWAPVTDEILEAAKRTFYAAWEGIDPRGYAGSIWIDDESWSGWELPNAVPKLSREIWQRLQPRLLKVLPSDEQLEHWQHDLFFTGFGAVQSSTGDLSFTLNVQWSLTQRLLAELQALADLARDAEVLADPLQGLSPSTQFVFRRLPGIVVVRGFGNEHRFRFRREPLGFQYIERLLKQPGHTLDMGDLVGSPPVSTRRRATCLESLYVRGYDQKHAPTGVRRPSIGFGRQAQADARTVRKVSARLTELRHEYDRAVGHVDLAAQARIAREQEQLQAYLAQVTGPLKGQIRLFRDGPSRANRRYIARVCEKLDEAGLRKLANHFRRHIHVEGRQATYRPPHEIRWVF